MQKYNDVVLDVKGNVVPTASITVTDTNGNPVTVYNVNSTGTPKTQPFTPNSLGEFSFYAPDGRYNIVVSYTGVTYTISDILFDDPVSQYAGPSGSSSVGFTIGVTGSNSRNLQDKGRERPSVLDFPGVDPTGATDSSAGLQAAINSGLDLEFIGGTYLANNLTQTTPSQRFYAKSKVTIKKNANGPILTVAGDHVEFNNISFSGDAVSPVFTGDNLVITGDHPRLINCGSRWAFGRAVKATGAHVQIRGTNDIYQTADTTATGYDIEIGVSGTATLYHHLVGVYTSQSTGGIKVIDTGSCVIEGGQIGKLYIAAGTKPAGVNGGSTIGVRIIGTVTVEQSSAVFSACECADNVTFAAGTSNGSFGESNILASGKTVTDNGTQDYITGKYNDGLYTMTGQIPAFENNVPVRFRKSDGTAGAGSTSQIMMTNGNVFQLINFVSGSTIDIEQAGAGDVRIAANGATGFQVLGATAKIAPFVATPAGGTAGTGLTFGTSVNFGIFYGSGAPTLAAAKGSLYIRSDGTTTNDRMFVNTNGSTTWTAVTTVA